MRPVRLILMAVGAYVVSDLWKTGHPWFAIIVGAGTLLLASLHIRVALKRRV